jgi:hypothetical protein
MNLDIGSILNDWPFENGQVTARRIQGRDGREKIQLRLELGLFQMEIDGRPDGQRPHGFDSLLAYYEHQLQNHKEQSGSDRGFILDEQACELLRSESLMYYQRYLAEFVLEDFEAVGRDTLRNLRLMDFCAAYAQDESDRYALEQYRPYVLMMWTRARANLALAENRFKAAMAILRAGIEKIGQFYRRLGQPEMARESGEIAILKGMAHEVQARIPVDPLQQMRKQLDKAVREERYEDAAGLRDQLRRAAQERKPGDNAPDADKDAGEDNAM